MGQAVSELGRVVGELAQKKYNTAASINYDLASFFINKNQIT